MSPNVGRLVKRRLNRACAGLVRASLSHFHSLSVSHALCFTLNQFSGACMHLAEVPPWRRSSFLCSLPLRKQKKLLNSRCLRGSSHLANNTVQSYRLGLRWRGWIHRAVKSALLWQRWRRRPASEGMWGSVNPRKRETAATLLLCRPPRSLDPVPSPPPLSP